MSNQSPRDKAGTEHRQQGPRQEHRARSAVSAPSSTRKGGDVDWLLAVVHSVFATDIVTIDPYCDRAQLAQALSARTRDRELVGVVSGWSALRNTAMSLLGVGADVAEHRLRDLRNVGLLRHVFRGPADRQGRWVVLGGYPAPAASAASG